MQLLRWPLLSVSLSVAFVSFLLAFSGAHAAEEAEAEAEAEEALRFWRAEFDALEAEILKLQELTASSIVAGDRPDSHVNSPRRKRKSPLAGLKIKLDPKSAADLEPTLMMLKAIYEEDKGRVSELNAREQKDKQAFAARDAQHRAKLAEIDTYFEKHKLASSMHANETADENRMWNHWRRARELQKQGFHASLKVQHATMEKVKAMIEMYEKTISGKASNAKVHHDLVKMDLGTQPEIVFLQGTQAAWRDLQHFCDGALRELRTARARLLRTRPASFS